MFSLPILQPPTTLSPPWNILKPRPILFVPTFGLYSTSLLLCVAFTLLFCFTFSLIHIAHIIVILIERTSMSVCNYACVCVGHLLTWPVCTLTHLDMSSWSLYTLTHLDTCPRDWHLLRGCVRACVFALLVCVVGKLGYKRCSHCRRWDPTGGGKVRRVVAARANRDVQSAG